MKDQTVASGADLSVAAAREAMLAAVQVVAGTERLPLRQARGRILAEAVLSPADVPGHDNSAMDGYAFRVADVAATGETRLRVVGKALAGHPYPVPLQPGEAVRIMTGAVVPAAADTVVPQEEVTASADGVVLQGPQKVGSHVRRAGEDLAAGAVALAAGTRLGTAAVGLLGSLGCVDVVVHRRLRVAFFSTGDELASPGQTLRSGQIYDSNRHTLAAALDGLGVEALDLGVVADDPVALEQTLRQAADQADVIVTSGGVSVGDADYVKDMLGRLGEVGFWKLKIKPGRPMAFGQIGQATLFGLPGNPVAVAVTFHQLVLPVLQRMMGMDPLPMPLTFPARCDGAIRKQPGRCEFQRGVAYQDGEGWRVRVLPNQSSGVLSSMVAANCFVVLAEPQGAVAAGDWVTVQPFAGLL